MSGLLDSPHLAERLARRVPEIVAPTLAERHAAVTLVVRAGEDDLEVLFVRRAEVPGDPWSGHMALPGGHRDPGDTDLIDTARRETREEVGLDLARDSFLGRLDDLYPVSRLIPSILISPFVAWHGGDARIETNEEVQYHVWAPVQGLRDPTQQSEMRYPDHGGERVLPTILLDGDTIWGLTHRIVMNFLEVLSEEDET